MEKKICLFINLPLTLYFQSPLHGSAFLIFPHALIIPPHTHHETARNDLGILKRKPSDLKRYLAWTADIKAQYGTITNYICQRRLGWHLPDPDTTTAATTGATTDSGAVFPFRNPIPFADPADYKILRNDWPYGVTPDINHLVVWLRTPVPVKPENGDVTDESRALIEDFVHRTFVARLAQEGNLKLSDPKENVLWFKNWTALQSVRSLEHMHVLVKGVPEHILQEWTGEPMRN